MSTVLITTYLPPSLIVVPKRKTVTTPIHTTRTTAALLATAVPVTTAALLATAVPVTTAVLPTDVVKPH